MPDHVYTIDGHRIVADHLLSPDEARAIQGRLVGGAQAPAAAPESPGLISRLGRLTEGPAGLREAVTAPGLGGELRAQAPLFGQVAGGLAGAALAPGTGGASLLIPAALGFLGGVGGSAVKRGGAPTLGDVGTAAASEAVPLVPGAGRAATRLLSERAAPRLMEAASRFKVPLGLGEASQSPVVQSAFGRLFHNPFPARALGRAGTLQSDAILAASDRISTQWFGGALPASAFGRQAAKAIGETVKRLPPDRAAALQGQVTELAGQVVTGTKLAEALAKAKPESLVPIMRQVGDRGMQLARSAWWTSALETATAKHGTRAGLVNPAKITAAWDRLGEQGQAQLFGNRAQHLRQFVDVLRSAKSAELAAGKTHLPNYFRYTAAGLILGRGGDWSARAAELLGVEAALPWAAAHALATGTAGEVSQLLAPVAPTLARAGAQAIGQAAQGSGEQGPRRADGSLKGPGFLGTLRRPDSRVSTELSIGVNIDGREMEIPSLVPTLTQAEIDHLLAGNKPTAAIVDKAVAHAKGRMAKGLGPFKEGWFKEP